MEASGTSTNGTTEFTETSATSAPPAPTSDPVPPATSSDPLHEARVLLGDATKALGSAVEHALSVGVSIQEAMQTVQAVLSNIGSPPVEVAQTSYPDPGDAAPPEEPVPVETTLAPPVADDQSNEPPATA